MIHALTGLKTDVQELATGYYQVDLYKDKVPIISLKLQHDKDAPPYGRVNGTQYPWAQTDLG